MRQGTMNPLQQTSVTRYVACWYRYDEMTGRRMNPLFPMEVYVLHRNEDVFYAIQYFDPIVDGEVMNGWKRMPLADHPVPKVGLLLVRHPTRNPQAATEDKKTVVRAVIDTLMKLGRQPSDLQPLVDIEQEVEGMFEIQANQQYEKLSFKELGLEERPNLGWDRVSKITLQEQGHFYRQALREVVSAAGDPAIIKQMKTLLDFGESNVLHEKELSLFKSTGGIEDIQDAWNEVYSFADSMSLKACSRISLAGWSTPTRAYQNTLMSDKRSCMRNGDPGNGST